uniref:Leucine-rich repeat-containing protein 40 n=1 Tax=Amphimedon queenslandica TaxID=400682 RepID=A0A1X7VSI4_AMPQE
MRYHLTLEKYGANLTKLSLSENKLKALPPLVALERITEIDVSQKSPNQLNEFPIIRPGNTFKIQTLQDDRLTHLSSLTILTLRENKLTMLPDSIVQLSKLKRLDLTNNDLSSLPYMLGRFESLHSLLLDGNPLKSIRRDILQKGTVELLKYLRSRIKEPEEHVSPPTSPSSLKIPSSSYKVSHKACQKNYSND